MNRFEEQINKAAKEFASEIRLSDDERTGMRDKLQEYISYKPIRMEEVEAEVYTFNIFDVLHSKYSAGVLGLAFLFVSSGVTFAAEKAMPGETLYSVKVNFNEEVVGALSFSDEAKTDWEIVRAERRLNEASQLASDGDFTDDIKQQIVEQFTRHASKVTEKAKEIGGVNPAFAAEISTEFENALEAHETILVSLAVEEDGNRGQASELAGAVRNAAKEVAQVRIAAEEVVAVAMFIEDDFASTSTVAVTNIDPVSLEQQQALARSMRDGATRSIDAAERELRRVRTLNPDLDVRAIEEQVGNANESFKQGNAFFADENYSEAYRAFKNAVAISETSVRYLQAQVELQLETLPFDIVVPEFDEEDAIDDTQVALVADQTENENATDPREQQRAELSARLGGLQEEVAGLIDEDAKTRAARVLKRADALLVRGEVALSSGDTSDAYRFFKTSDGLLDDVADILTESNNQVTGEEPTVTDEPQDEPVSTTTDQVDTVDTADPIDPVNVSEDTLSIRHSFGDGTHTYSGWVTTPSPCHTVGAQSLVAESFPEQISLEITISESDGMCTQVLDSKPFEVEVPASEGATLNHVRVNGESVEFVLVAGETALSEDLEIIEEAAPEEESEELVTETQEQDTEEVSEEGNTVTYKGTKALLDEVIQASRETN